MYGHTNVKIVHQIINYTIPLRKQQDISYMLSMYSLLLSMYSYCSSMYSYCCLCVLIVVYVLLDVATLSEVFPCFFFGCKANVRV